MAHAGERVEGGSISPDLPQGLDYRTELLAGRARAAAETLQIPGTHSADKRTLTGVPLVDYCKATVSPKRGSFEPSLPTALLTIVTQPNWFTICSLMDSGRQNILRPAYISLTFIPESTGIVVR